MDDDAIIRLFRERDEAALREVQIKYGNYLSKIARSILPDPEDCRESVSDAYLEAWRSIPPHEPQVLSAYLARLTRQKSIDIYRKRHSGKRRGNEYALSLDELGECVSGGNATEQEIDARLLSASVSAYLRTLPGEMRNVFVCRYFFHDSIKEIAGGHGMSVPKVKSMLHRARRGLKAHLESEGFL